ncbi:N-acetyltransferase [Niveibacterium sp. SC-1]|uniref:GNAT family N-acetyltransferase n=1 Tax=Niveibacterium sp. SC-1 TaxID=3135646 RepID=UPI00311ECC18
MLIEIRDEAQADLRAIDSLTREAFADQPCSSHTEHFIVRALREAGALAVSLVAVSEGVVVGHVAVSAVRVEGAYRRWFGLGPVSVVPACQGLGVGSGLVRAALARLQANGAAGCVVLGDPAYYARFGFAHDPALSLPGAPPEYFMRLAWEADLPTGEVTFDAAFDATA